MWEAVCIKILSQCRILYVRKQCAVYVCRYRRTIKNNKGWWERIFFMYFRLFFFFCFCYFLGEHTNNFFSTSPAAVALSYENVIK